MPVAVCNGCRVRRRVRHRRRREGHGRRLPIGLAGRTVTNGVDDHGLIEPGLPPAAEHGPRVDAGAVAIAPVDRQAPCAAQLGVQDRDRLVLTWWRPRNLTALASTTTRCAGTCRTQCLDREDADHAVIEGDRDRPIANDVDVDRLDHGPPSSTGARTTAMTTTAMMTPL